jgi:hypothetical protein
MKGNALDELLVMIAVIFAILFVLSFISLPMYMVFMGLIG